MLTIVKFPFIFLCMCVCVFVCGGVGSGGGGFETKSTAHILKQDLRDFFIFAHQEANFTQSSSD